jgi:hypothetical protein
MNILFMGLVFITAFIPRYSQPARPLSAPIYTTTIASNVPATLGCIWEEASCDVQCTSCEQTICVSESEYSSVGACLTVTDEILAWNATGTPESISMLTADGYLRALWSGYTYQGEQSIDYQVITVGSADDNDWSFPTEPLVPYEIEDPPVSLNAPLTPARLWEIARVALTSYTIISGDDANTWLIFSLILLIPISGTIIYYILTRPPDI